uniref:Calcineurin-like phosphoesterase domain-containing protein n=1 Tax=Oryza meridionalis TaxID=40149 RepID=A0A0E0D5B2_9ORYZ
MANSGKKLMDDGVASQTLPRAAGDDNADDDYVRPPPRPLVSAVHDKPATHPQQVHISVDEDLLGHRRRRRPELAAVRRGVRRVSGGVHGVGDGRPRHTEWTAATLSHIGGADYDVALVAGDLSYADGRQPLWDSFGRLVQPLASARPWMVTEGNHEKEKTPPPPVAGAGGVRLPSSRFAAYNARWRMPREESGSPSNLYYSFDAAGGAAHVVMLGSYAYAEERGEGTAEQRAWLERDLAGVNRRRTPWVVAVAHGPWYSTNGAH